MIGKERMYLDCQLCSSIEESTRFVRFEWSEESVRNREEDALGPVVKKRVMYLFLL